MPMKRKLLMLLASCSLAAFIIFPVSTIGLGVENYQSLIKPMIHGAGD